LLLDEELTKNPKGFGHSWMTIECVLPFIQLAINQRRPRFTTFSPNMLMFGTNLRDISDIGHFQEHLDKFRKDSKTLSKTDYGYLTDLVSTLKRINESYKSDWKDYTWLSRTEYNTKYKITPAKIRTYHKIFKIGSKVLYFIGDKKGTTGKWRPRWTGPWLIHKKLNDMTMIIVDPSTGNQKRVSVDRLKVYKERDYIQYNDFYTGEPKRSHASFVDNEDMDYSKYQERLFDSLSNYSVDMPDQDPVSRSNLDYRKP
jgi:hypothetical protein